MGEAFITRRGSSSRGCIGKVYDTEFVGNGFHGMLLSNLGFIPRRVEIQRLSPVSSPSDFTIMRMSWSDDGIFNIYYYDDYSDGNLLANPEEATVVRANYDSFQIIMNDSKYQFEGQYCWVAYSDIE